MKAILIVVAILIVAGVRYTVSQNNSEAPETVPAETVETTEVVETTEETGVTETETAAELDAEDQTESAGTVQEFTIDGFNFGYDISEIRVKEGDTVTINLTSSDGFHDWVVDEFDAATEKIREGGNTSVTFVADKAGTYEFYCSVGSHRANGMVGTLIVE